MAMNIIIIVFELHVYGTRKNLTYKKNLDSCMPPRNAMAHKTSLPIHYLFNLTDLNKEIKLEIS